MAISALINAITTILAKNAAINAARNASSLRNASIAEKSTVVIVSATSAERIVASMRCAHAAAHNIPLRWLMATVINVAANAIGTRNVTNVAVNISAMDTVKSVEANATLINVATLSVTNTAMSIWTNAKSIVQAVISLRKNAIPAKEMKAIQTP